MDINSSGGILFINNFPIFQVSILLIVSFGIQMVLILNLSSYSIACDFDAIVSKTKVMKLNFCVFF